MRFSPTLPAIAVATLLLNGAFLLLPVFAQSYDDVQVRKNPDGSIETFDSSDSSAPAPRGRSGSGYKKSSHRYNDGVTVRKNPDGSIETFDSGGGSPSPRHASAGHSSSRSVKKHTDAVVKKPSGGSAKTPDTSGLKPPRSQAGSGGAFQFVHKYSKGVTVKKNPDGTIEVIGSESDLINPGRSSQSNAAQKSSSAAKPASSTKSGTASKSGLTKSGSSAKVSAAKPKRRAAHRSKGRGNYGDVRVIRNPDGSIETYDAN